MSSAKCALDRLPVELVHQVFSYFYAHELLFTFSNLSDYIHTILLNYSSYRVTLQGIFEEDFDQIYHHLHPNRVVSLILSDHRAFTRSYLTRYPIQEFVHLRSLKLLQIEYTTIELVFSNLDRLSNLRALSFDATLIRHLYPAWNDDYRHESQKLNRFLDKSYTRIFPHLTHLHLTSLQQSSSAGLSFPYLHHLILTQCSIDQVNNVLGKAPQLQVLDISICGNTWNSDVQSPSSRLKDLRLKITGNPVAFDRIEQCLKELSHLKYFTLECPTDIDLLDGNRWQALTKHLIGFRFKLTLLNLILSRDYLRSFSTAFWLQEKQWCIISDGQCLFSVPHFLPDQIDLSQQNASVDPLVDRRVTKLILHPSSTIDNYRHFPHVTQVDLHGVVPLAQLQSMINLEQLVRLSLDSFDYLQSFLPIDLSIHQSVTMASVRPYRKQSFKQIRRLKLSTVPDPDNALIDELLHLFPSIEVFLYTSHELSTRVMIRFVDGFQYLSSASFHTDASYAMKENSSCRTPHLFIDRSTRLNHDNTTCRVYHTINARLSLLIEWSINKQKATKPYGNRLLPGIERFWHRFKYFLRTNLLQTSVVEIFSHVLRLVLVITVLLCASMLFYFVYQIPMDGEFLYQFVSHLIVCFLIDQLRHEFESRNRFIVKLCIFVIIFVLSQLIRTLGMRLLTK